MKKTAEITTDKILDSREVEERIDELEGQEDKDEDETAELAALTAFREEVSQYNSDWPHGVGLIRDDYFEDYAQEQAEGMSDMKTSQWPYNCIDWARAARELQYDYSSSDLMGETYWFLNT